MAIPADPTATTVVLAGMKMGGQYSLTSSSTAVTDFLTDQFQTIKTELWAVNKTDHFLDTYSALVANVGNSAVTLPTDFDSEVELWIYDAPDTWRGTAQAGGAASITLASTFASTTAADLQGRYIFTTGGTGSGQFAQITDYNNTTKVVTVAANWTTPPDSTTTYLVQVRFRRLIRDDHYRSITPNTFPYRYSIYGAVNLLVYPAPDRIYPILMKYRPNLTRLDEAGTTFVKHLRERRSLWLQGIKTYTMQRYDDDRYQVELPLWEAAKARYAAESVTYDHIVPNR